MLPAGKSLAFAARGERRCLGVRRAGRWIVCPYDAVLDGASARDQCARCAQLDRSRSVAADTMADDPRPYGVYLAYFGPGLLKVEITAAERGAARLVEQGAVAYAWLGRGPLMAAVVALGGTTAILLTQHHTSVHTAAIATPKHTSSASAAPHTSTTTPPSGIGTPRTEEPAGGGSSGGSDSDGGANGGVPAPAPGGGPGPGSAESTASGGPRPTGGTGGKGGAPSRPGAVGGTDGSTPRAPKPWSSCNYYSGDALTQYGDSGDRAVEVQCILKARGYNIGPTGVDGKFGDATRGKGTGRTRGSAGI
ncbi:DUF2797 domain-containing protein [Streptomyces lydicus]|uniref:DUF2797 domain-containing protein n=1 Tax=Streptomyces lydicus TaxID=47763 RepID=UPI00379855E1